MTNFLPFWKPLLREISDATSRARIIPRLRRAFWLGAAGLLSLAGTFFFFYWVNTRSAELVQNMQVIGRLARESQALTVERESAIRGYLLSKHAVSLAPEIMAREVLRFKLDSLVRLTRDNASQNDRAKAIVLAVDRWERGWAKPALSAGTIRSPIADADAAGMELFDSIRASLVSFLAGQKRTYDRLVAIQAFIQSISLGALILEIGLLLTVLIWFSKRSIRQVEALFTQQDQLEEQRSDLENQATELEEQAMELEEQHSEAIEVSNRLAESNDQLRETVARLQSVELVATTATSQHEEMQSLLDFVLNSSPVGVSLRDSNLKLIRVNAALVAMTGMSATEMTYRPLDEIMSDDISDVLESAYRDVLEKGQPLTNIPLSGTTRAEPNRARHFLVSCFPVSLPGGGNGVGTVVLETTQYRQLEDQLVQAQKMEAVGRLAGGVAHDFNNMLTAIMSYGELLIADMPIDSPQRADMLEILKAGEKATTLTRKLLAFSRQQVLRPSVVNLNETLEGLHKMLQRLMSAGIKLNFKLSPNLWPVTADATEIERVIVNLALNSRDAMADGGQLNIETSNVEIDDEYASTHAETVPGEYVMMAVSDTGAGMTREVREKLFEPFFTTKEKGEGTGLGLPSVYGIVKQSGGFVWVYSELGCGTTFKVYLPRAKGTASDARRTPRRNRTIGGETILLVEDDDEVRNVATRILRRNGYRVLEAANGAEALRVCESEDVPVDLIVTDIVMPEMGGAELAVRVRETQPDARILFTSGYTEDTAVRQSFLDPGEAFIGKPFTPASLAKKAREVLDSSSIP